MNAGNVSCEVTHGFAQCHEPDEPEQLPEYSKFGDGTTFTAGLWPGRIPLATTRFEPVKTSTETSSARMASRRTTCRVLS